MSKQHLICWQLLSFKNLKKVFFIVWRLLDDSLDLDLVMVVTYQRKHRTTEESSKNR